MDEQQKAIIEHLSSNTNDGVDYFKTLKQFKLNEPGTKTFSELREIITKELKTQLGIKKNFKIQIRRTGGSKESDYAFLDCFLNDKKTVFVSSRHPSKEISQQTIGTWMTSPAETSLCVLVNT